MFISGVFPSCSDEEKERKFVNMSELDFGDGIYRPNPFKFLDNIPPFSWMGMPDSVRKVTELQISFNEDAVRSHASGRIILVDHNGNKIKGIVINGNALNEVNIPSGSKSVIIPISFTANPAVGDSILHGSVMVVGNELDQVNDIHLATQATPIALWKLTHKTGINWLRWIILFALIALLCVIGYFIYKEIIKYYIYKDIMTTVKRFSITKPLHHNRFINKENKKKKQEKEEPIIKKLLYLESKLYTDIPIYTKYNILEEMRLALDSLYSNGHSETYNKAKSVLKTNTWGALEEAWQLWSPTPTSDVKWDGANNRICTLESSHKFYKELEKINFLSCSYDEHGSPDFNKVTYPKSVVNISDLYQSYSCEQLSKRGGGEKSFQEVAQKRMAESLAKEITVWAKKNNCSPDFYKWRDAHDLVPHEDTNCRTMRLVSRTAHIAFKHRGGIANANNIKKHFS